MGKYSRYTIVVDNISSSTPTRDLEAEFRYAGRIRDLARDHKTRCALIESADADYAWRKLNGISMNGRKMKVEWATKTDFKMFGWKWYEDSPSPPPRKARSPSRSVSRSRSRSRSASRSRSRSASRSKSRSPSQSPPSTPSRKDDKKDRDGDRSDDK